MRELERARDMRQVRDAEVMLLPLSRGNHWFVIEINALHKKVVMYDSQVMQSGNHL